MLAEKKSMNEWHDKLEKTILILKNNKKFREIKKSFMDYMKMKRIDKMTMVILEDDRSDINIIIDKCQQLYHEFFSHFFPAEILHVDIWRMAATEKLVHMTIEVRLDDQDEYGISAILSHCF